MGNGESIDMWSDNWLPRDNLLRVITPDIHKWGPIAVSCLIHRDTNTWDENILQWLLWEDDASAVLQIPLGSRDTPDCRVWHYSRNGFYSVRSAYHVARTIRQQRSEIAASSRSRNAGDNWEFIWHINLPPKPSSVIPHRNRCVGLFGQLKFLGLKFLRGDF